MPHDLLRCAVLGGSTAAFVLVPTLGPLLAGTEEGADAYDTDITPPNYAFAIWAPIFLSNAAATVQHLADPAAPENRRHGWWLAGAHAANAAWSVAAQSGRFRYTAAILPVAAGLAAVAHRRLQPGERVADAARDEPAGGRRDRAARTGRAHRPPVASVPSIAPHSVGLLLGWTGVAAVVNAFAVRRSPAPARASAAAVVAASAALAAAVATSRRGSVAVAAAGGWALSTLALYRKRTLVARSSAAVGAGMLAVSAASAIARRRG